VTAYDGGDRSTPIEESEDEDYITGLMETEPEHGLCPNCGNPYPITAEWSNTTLCSPRCVAEYLRYVDAPWGTR
jgi:hypothetical protein